MLTGGVLGFWLTDSALLDMCSWICNGRASGKGPEVRFVNLGGLTADSTLISWLKKIRDFFIEDLRVASEDFVMK